MAKNFFWCGFGGKMKRSLPVLLYEFFPLNRSPVFVSETGGNAARFCQKKNSPKSINGFLLQKQGEMLRVFVKKKFA